MHVRKRQSFDQDLAERAAELERSNSELAQFAFVASHDLQEPLRMVVSYLELVRARCRDTLDREASEYIGFAVDAAVRMKQLVGDLLTYARVGSQPLALATVDVNAVVASAVHGLGLQVAQSGAEVTSDVLPWVRCDAVQLERVFIQLVDNAIKYRSEAPPRIHIAARRQDGCWQFTVADNGIGIDPVFGQKVFEIFKGLHGAAGRSGNGIGLAVAKTAVERHGGRIWVGPADGGGSVFRFTLPASLSTKQEGRA